MKKTKKHTAPLRCRWWVRLRKPDWTGFAVCDIGAGSCRRCQGCEHYKPDKVRDDIIAAAELLKESIHKLGENFKTLKFQLAVSLPKETPHHKEDDDATVH